jgi:hypothetical protein
MGARIACAENSNLLCVLKTLSELMMLRNRLCWRDDRASLFRAGNVARPYGEKSGSALRADHLANAIVQDRAPAWKSAIGAQGRNRIVHEAIELEPFFESLFSSVPIDVPGA